MAGDLTTVARPYAEAAFAVARAHGTIERWSAALALLSAIVADPRIAVNLSNPRLTRERRGELVLAVAGEALESLPANLVRLLAANGRLAALPEIARLFEQMNTAARGVRHIRVRSAFALDEPERRLLTTTLQTHFGSALELVLEEDPSLIGGVEIRADDVVIDGSVRGRLQQLANALQS